MYDPFILVLNVLLSIFQTCFVTRPFCRMSGLKAAFLRTRTLSPAPWSALLLPLLLLLRRCCSCYCLPLPLPWLSLASRLTCCRRVTARCLAVDRRGLTTTTTMAYGRCVLRWACEAGTRGGIQNGDGAVAGVGDNFYHGAFIFLFHL